MRLVGCDDSEYDVADSWEDVVMAQQPLFGTEEAIKHETIVEHKGPCWPVSRGPPAGPGSIGPGVIGT